MVVLDDGERVVASQGLELLCQAARVLELQGALLEAEEMAAPVSPLIEECGGGRAKPVVVPLVRKVAKRRVTGKRARRKGEGSRAKAARRAGVLVGRNGKGERLAA